MEWLQTLLDGSTIPAVTALLLGLLTAISPCPLATNITAIGYITKECRSARTVFWRGILYTIGRVAVYAGLGFVLIHILRSGASLFAVQKVIATCGEMILAPSLIVIGLFMLFGHMLNLPKFGIKTNGAGASRGGMWGALLLGVLFAFAFCPSSGVIYFGMLIPLAAAENGGYLLPFIYAIGTGLPVIVVAWVLAYSVSGIGRFYQKLQAVQRWMNIIIALLFIGVGIYYLTILYL